MLITTSPQASQTRTASTMAFRVQAPLGQESTPGFNLSDSYTPSESTSGLFVNRQQMLAVAKAGAKSGGQTAKAAAPDMAGAVKSHNYDQVAAQLNGMSGNERMKFLADFRTKHKDEYKALLADMRAGKIADPNLKVGVSLDMLGNTKWAASKEGKQIMSHLKQQYQDGRISVDPKMKGTSGLTVQDDPNASKSQATIKIRGFESNSPEAMAAVLAHEGQHSVRSHDGAREQPLKEEVEGNLVTATVWNELGPDKLTWEGASKYETTGKYNTYEKMMNRKVGPYMVAYYEKGTEGKAQARQMLGEYMDYNTKTKGASLTNMDNEDLINFEYAANGMDAGLSGDEQKKVQTQIATVQAELKRRNLAPRRD